MILPEEFQNRMRRLLGEEYDDFEASYEKKPVRSLHLNSLKAGEEFFARMPSSFAPVPWAEDGYYYAQDAALGKHPYHEAGVYYIQEASAMAPAEYLDARPGERVLDLCAAPGGKSIQIAAQMKGRGILFCNEIHPLRAKILSENIERMGISNAVVTNETPQHLLEFFAGYFDKILVDAPCSGEGMFCKNETALLEWSVENILRCAKRQDEILSCAAEMLRAGGKLVYSTCTFAPEENEGSISRFLKKFPEFEPLSAEKKAGMEYGRIDGERIESPHMLRLFPHKLRGEGHFLALVQKKGESSFRPSIKEEKGLPEKSCKDWLDFCKENFISVPEGIYTAFGEQLYLLPAHTPSLRGLKVLRPGLCLGARKKNRIEPSHALALYLKKEDVRRSIDFPSDRREIYDYLRGEAVSAEGEKGWHLVTVDGYSIGWGKRSGGILKNHYPKGLRKSFFDMP